MTPADRPRCARCDQLRSSPEAAYAPQSAMECYETTGHFASCPESRFYARPSPADSDSGDGWYGEAEHQADEARRRYYERKYGEEP